MADKKIPQLDPLVTQLSTDVYESSDSLGNFPSKKETRSQQLAYTNANAQLPSSAKITGLDDQLAAKANTNGSNATGTWSISITGNSSTVTTNANLTGDVSSVGNSTTLATVNLNPGSYGYDDLKIPFFSVNSKGLVTDSGENDLTLQKLGIPTGPGLIITTSTVLSNPPPPWVVCNFSTPGQSLTLPAAQDAINTPMSPGQPIRIIGFQPSTTGVVKDSSGNTLVAINAGQSFSLELNDNSTPNGSWITYSEFPIMNPATVVAGSSGSVGLVTGLTSTDGTVSINSSVDRVLDFTTALQVKSISSGDNIVLAMTGDKNLQISSTAVTPTGSSNFSGQSVIANTVATTLAASNTYYPIFVNGPSLQDIISSNFMNQILSISGVNTPVMKYTDDASQYFDVEWNLFIKGAVASQQTYVFEVCIYKADTSILTTGFQGTCVVQDLIFPTTVPICATVQLSTNDSVFLRVKNLSNAQGMYVVYYTATATNVNAAASATLQTAYTNGDGVIQADLDSKPLIIKNSSMVEMLRISNSHVDILGESSGEFVPVLTNGVGASGANLDNAMYARKGSIVEWILKFSVTATAGKLQVSFSLPIASAFTATNQAMGVGIVSNASPDENIGDGQISLISSNSSTGQIDLNISVAVGSGVKDVSAIGSYRII